MPTTIFYVMVDSTDGKEIQQKKVKFIFPEKEEKFNINDVIELIYGQPYKFRDVICYDKDKYIILADFHKYDSIYVKLVNKHVCIACHYTITQNDEIHSKCGHYFDLRCVLLRSPNPICPHPACNQAPICVVKSIDQSNPF